MSATTGQYVRAKTRIGPVSVSTKIFQAIGALPEGLKTFAFNTFLLFFYNQVLGLPAAEASLALGTALIIDAAVDPLVGSFSDNLKTRLGRRHLLMYLAALPVGLALFFVFSPPADASHGVLVAWLFAGAVATNVSLSFFVVPWTALYAEFSDDYAERTQIVTYRYATGWIGVIAFTFAVWSFIFPSSPHYPLGQLNPASYRFFAPVIALVIPAAILATTHLTRREIPYLQQPTGSAPAFAPLRILRDITEPFANREFVLLFSGALLTQGINGTTDALTIYNNSYFWGLTPEQLRWFVISIAGAIIAFLTIGKIEDRFEKKPALIGSFVFLMIDGAAITLLRVFDVLPHNGDPRLLAILIANESFRIFLNTVLGIMFVSMLADTLEVQELKTGKRQEGMFAAAISFSGKATAGIGALMAGQLLQQVIHWPAKVDVHHLAGAPVMRLGIVAGIFVPVLLAIPLCLGFFYRITRASHAATRAELEKRRAASHAPGGIEPTHEHTVVELEAVLSPSAPPNM